MDIEEHSFKYNFIIGTKLKQSLILGLDFAQRYKLGVDWDLSGTLYLRHDGWKIATTTKKDNSKRQVMTIYDTALAENKK